MNDKVRLIIGFNKNENSNDATFDFDGYYYEAEITSKKDFFKKLACTSFGSYKVSREQCLNYTIQVYGDFYSIQEEVFYKKLFDTIRLNDPIINFFN